MKALSLIQAQNLILKSQGLNVAKPFGSGKKAIIKSLEQLGYAQIDSISVICRAHHHSLWNRNPGYTENAFWSLLNSEKQLFEYWTHAASFIPIRDFRFYLPVMHSHRVSDHPWFKSPKGLEQFILDRIKAEGPLKARDFTRTDAKKSGGWWDWKPAKKTLEALFFKGALVVSARENFQKVYDLPQRALPSDIDLSIPDKNELWEYRILNILKAQGLATLNDICYLKKGWKVEVNAVLNNLVEEGEVVALRIKGNDKDWYASNDVLNSGIFKSGSITRFLSPFDNLIIRRKRLLELFQFDYQLECYVPAAKRQYGYFVLPIFHHNKFVGRIELKLDRKTASLNIVNLYFETTPSEKLFLDISTEIIRFANWQASKSINVIGCKPNKYKAVLKNHIKTHFNN
ncbi:MAG: hypothetical protein ACI959_001031 [Limisphaerales bacterium]